MSGQSQLYYSLIVALAAILVTSLSRDLGRAFRWFLRSLGRVFIALCIIVFAASAIFIK